MPNPVKSAVEILEKLRKKTDTVLIGYSGGKESRVCVDLCSKTFENIVPFHMYFLKNISIMQDNMKWLKERYGLECLMYPSKMIMSALRESAYRPYDPTMAELPVVDPKMIYHAVISDTGIHYMILGWRSDDSLSRRRIMSRTAGKTEYLCHPLKDWTRWDVFAYLRTNKIPIPPSTGEATSDISLNNAGILWLHDAFPEDYEKVKAVFPDIESHVERRTLYGIGERYTRNGPIKKQ